MFLPHKAAAITLFFQSEISANLGEIHLKGIVNTLEK